MAGLRIGVDIGGTFTDVIATTPTGRRFTAKLPTQPEALAEAVITGIATIQQQAATHEVASICYGTTLAANALLQHRLPPIALIVTAGFREILEINAAHGEDHHEPTSSSPHRHRLVALEHVYELSARLTHDGTERLPLNPDEVSAIALAIVAVGIRVVALSLLHSYQNPAHENATRELLQQTAPELRIVLSSEVLPEFREYERTVTTCLNAALLPLLQDHLREIAARTRVPLFVMKSSGGLGTPDNVLARPLATVLSGPSAAVVGLSALARRLKLPNVLTLDVGGTSTDVAVINRGNYAVTARSEIAGLPLKMSTVDVLSIGAGGGSIATSGNDRRWRVGPESAGAVPGPICYGRGGDRITLTDAELLLGRLPSALLGGHLPLEVGLVERALTNFGRERGLDAMRTAAGLLQIATHQMCGALRRVSVQRGLDPASYVLFAIGGAGPQHAAELAQLLDIKTIVVPRHPGLAAADGLLQADFREDAAQSCAQSERKLDCAQIATTFATLEARVVALLSSNEHAADPCEITRAADLRYAGMSSEFTIPCDPGEITEDLLRRAIDSFHAHYALHTGQAYRNQQEVLIETLRVSATRRLRRDPRAPSTVGIRHRPDLTAQRLVYHVSADEFIMSAIYRGAQMIPGAELYGPAVIEYPDSTLIVPPGFFLELDDDNNAILRAGTFA